MGLTTTTSHHDQCVIATSVVSHCWNLNTYPQKESVPRLVVLLFVDSILYPRVNDFGLAKSLKKMIKNSGV